MLATPFHETLTSSGEEFSPSTRAIRDLLRVEPGKLWKLLGVAALGQRTVVSSWSSATSETSQDETAGQGDTEVRPAAASLRYLQASAPPERGLGINFEQATGKMADYLAQFGLGYDELAERAAVHFQSPVPLDRTHPLTPEELSALAEDEKRYRDGDIS